MLVVLHGEDIVRAAEVYARLRAEADPMGLSTTVLDDPRAALDEIIQAADAAPFFGGQRFVGVRGYLARLTRPSERGKAAASTREAEVEGLAAYLRRLPTTTTLVFWDAVTLKLPSALERAVRDAGTVQTFETPSRPGDLQAWLVTWLEERARAQAVTLTRDAAQRLAAIASATLRAGESADRDQRVGVELLRLDTELTRLSTYAGVGAPIDGAIVAAQVPDAQAHVFDLVDAVATRATPRALRLLDQVLAEGTEPLALLRLLDRQMSALLRAAAAGGTERAIEARLRAPAWLARRYAQQLRGLGRPALLRAHRRVLLADLRIKTGQASGEAAVRDLVMTLCLDSHRAA